MALFGLANKVDSRLEERAQLAFIFPNPKGGTPFTRYCPFFENPEINESQAANLISYDVIGRAGNFFGYTGAKSRQFTVNFNLTLPVLLELSVNRTLHCDRSPNDMSPAEAQAEFFLDTSAVSTEQLAKYDKVKAYSDYRNAFLRNQNDGKPIIPGSPGIPGGVMSKAIAAPMTLAFGQTFGSFVDNMISTPEGDLLSNIGAYQLAANTDKQKVYAEAVDLMTYWVNIIRSSVLNYAPTPTVGPPIVRLSFGTLYRNIATVASKYSIRVDDKAGYDVPSLLPRQVTISMVLNEIKTAVANEFEAGDPINKDAANGWEVLLNRGTNKLPNLDPGAMEINGDIPSTNIGQIGLIPTNQMDH